MMKKTTSGWMLFAFAVLSGTTFFTSCSSDNDIDLGDLDQTIGIGGEGFEIPAGNAEKTRLGDVLDIKNSDVIDTLANGDYFFSKGDTIDPAKPKVKQVSFGQQHASGDEITVPIKPTGEEYTIPEEGPIKIASFKFIKDPEEDLHQIKSLTRAEINGNITLVMHVEKLKNATGQLDMNIYLPDYFGIDASKLPSYCTLFEESSLDGYEELQLKNVTTSRPLELTIALNELKNFDTQMPSPLPDNYLFVNSEDLEMQGLVKMQMHLKVGIDKTAGTELVTIDDPELDQNITVTHAEGYFDPDIDLDESHVDINDIPDFLNDENVNIKLYNPQIAIEINNNIDIEADVVGTMTATYADGKKKMIDVTKGGTEMIVMKPASVTPKSKIVICRYAPTNPDPDTQYIELRGTGEAPQPDGTVVVEDIANILNKIPDYIDFKFDASANTTKIGKIDLYKEGTENNPNAHGAGYEIEPSYVFTAPLALEAGSSIVYNDSIDGWNKDIKDNKINFYDGASLTVEATVENNTPLDQLVIKNPKAIGIERDAQGNAKEIKDAKVELLDANGNVISGNKGLVIDKNGSNKTLRLKVSGTLENLDGVKFEVQAKTTSTSPETLNTQKHTISINDMKLKLDGKLIIELDS